MRRYLMAWTVLMGAMMGCNHTAGVCDCDTGCCGGGGATPGILRPEPLHMPGVNGDAKPAALPIDKAKDMDEK